MKLLFGKLSIFSGWMKDRIVSNDLFPRTISFTYEGKSSFKTLFGGFVSILIELAILSIIVMLTITIIKRESASFNSYKVIKDISTDLTQHYFAKNKDIYFAIRLSGPNPEKLLDSSYFSFNIYQAEYFKHSSSSSYTNNSKQIEFELCGDRFPYVSKDVYDRIGLSTAYSIFYI